MKRLMISGAALFFAAAASAHDAGCDGKPVPDHIKAACCGKADAHQLSPSQVEQDAQGNWNVMIGQIVLHIPALRTEPSPDGCYWIFWPATIPAEDLNPNVSIYCFLVPEDF